MLIRFKHCRQYRRENKRQNQPYYLYTCICHIWVHRRCRRFVSLDLNEMIRVKCVYTLNHYNKQRTKNPILIQIEHPLRSTITDTKMAISTRVINIFSLKTITYKYNSSIYYVILLLVDYLCTHNVWRTRPVCVRCWICVTTAVVVAVRCAP